MADERRATESGRTVAINFLSQAIFIFVAAVLAQSRLSPVMRDRCVAERLTHNQEVDFIVLLPIDLLASQFGGQIVTSRQLGYNEVPTNVLTSLYCDLFSNPNIFAPWSKNPKRNRRILSAVLMLCWRLAGLESGRDEHGVLDWRFN